MAYSCIGGTVGTSLKDETPKWGDTYYYKVVAYYKDSAGKITKAAASKAVAGYAAAGDAIITETTRTAATVGKITWRLSGYADGYYVYRSEDGKSFSFVGGTTNTSYTDKTVDEGSVYYYKVVAYKKTAKGEVKSRSNVMIPLAYNKPSFGVYTSGQGRIAIPFSSSSLFGEENSGVYVYRAKWAETFKFLGGTITDVYFDNTVVSGTEYFYKICYYWKVDGAVVKSLIGDTASATAL